MGEDFVPFEGLPQLQKVVKEYNQKKKVVKMGIKLVPHKGVTAYIKSPT